MRTLSKRSIGPILRLGAICVGLTLASGAPALAQSAGVDHVPGPGFQLGSARAEGLRVMRPGALLFASFDRNFDGRITAEEIDLGAAGAFAAADRNSDGQITGFEQSDWSAAVGAVTDVLANPMAFDTDLDRSVTPLEFAAGIRRIADSLAGTVGGDIAFADLVQPLSGGAQAERGGPGGASGRDGKGRQASPQG